MFRFPSVPSRVPDPSGSAGPTAMTVAAALPTSSIQLGRASSHIIGSPAQPSPACLSRDLGGNLERAVCSLHEEPKLRGGEE